MKEEFPTDDWYIKVIDENIEILNNWRTAGGKLPYANGYLFNTDSHLGMWNSEPPINRIEITTSQFKEFVLNIKEEPIPIINEDLTYLKDMLDKLNIK